MDNSKNIDQFLLQLNNELSLPEKEELRKQLISYINQLLLNDFNKLVLLLYKVDVNEQRLKMLLKENPETDAANLIADLLIQRQYEKIKSKKAFKPDEDIAEEDKW